MHQDGSENHLYDVIGSMGDDDIEIDMNSANQWRIVDNDASVTNSDFLHYSRNSGDNILELDVNTTRIKGALRHDVYDVTFSEGDTTPTLLDANGDRGTFFRLHIGSGPGTTDITDFDDKLSGQHIYIYSPNALSKFVDGSGIKTTTGADKTSAASRVYQFLYNGVDWIEIGPLDR